MNANHDEALINLTSTPADQALVSVIIPAKDAVATLDRTLWSVRGQTYENLEIIVVDDASSDGTPAIVEAHIAQDPRIKLATNLVCRGVGGARNVGAAHAHGAFLCFIDADDLMTPDSVAVRLAELQRSSAGMCYCWSAIIDEDDRVLNTRSRPVHQGSIYETLALSGNFIGNGSSALVTRAAFEAIGGYSERLFKAGAQGCEDYNFHLDMARKFPVACVPAIHIGYRETPDNMSSDPHRMMRSMRLVQDEITNHSPQYAKRMWRVRDDLRIHIAVKSWRAGRRIEAARLLLEIGTGLPHRIYRYLRHSLRIRGMKGDLLPGGSVFPYTRPAGAPAGSADTAFPVAGHDCGFALRDIVQPPSHPPAD